MYDIVVIGGGPAGLTAALYAARAGKKVMLLEANAFGGQIATSPRVENFPSVAETTGAALADKMFEQTTSHGVEFDMGRGKVSLSENGFVVTTEYATYSCKAVVLATGVTHKTLNVKGEEHLRGKGVCYCAVCDAAFYKDKPVCVVGDGNSAVQYALYLSEICSQVTLVTIFDKLFCDRELERRLCLCDKIDWVRNVRVTEITGSECVDGLIGIDDGGRERRIDCAAVFVAIGQEPHNEDFAELVNLNEQGYVVAGEDCRTSCKGVFAAGDCRTKSVRQCATAIGDGAIAGLAAAEFAELVK